MLRHYKDVEACRRERKTQRKKVRAISKRYYPEKNHPRFGRIAVTLTAQEHSDFEREQAASNRTQGTQSRHMAPQTATVQMRPREIHPSQGGA
jgi:hypothetical protein